VSSGPEPGALRAPASYGLSNRAAPAGERLPWDEVERWLIGSRNYWICTVRPEGRPHAMPVWAIWLDRALAFSTHPSTRKGRNLAANPELVAHTESGDEVAILEGRAEALERGELLERFVDAYESKYGFRIEPSERALGLFIVRPRVVFAWREADFVDSATRWRF
jgi:Pyridoxamine 5'-phosphate oxidase